MTNLKEWELLTNVRAADVREGDVVELPDRVWIWDDTRADQGDARWRGVSVPNTHESRLSWPRWHFVYAALNGSDVGTPYAAHAGAECALEELEDHFVLLRIGAEQPMDRSEPEDRLVGLHQFDLLRVQRPVALSPATLTEPAWVVLEHQGTAVHWDDASPGLQVFLVDWDEAEDSAEYTAEKRDELDRATYLPDVVRARLREQLER